MTLTRRKTLALLGGGTIVAAGAAAGAFLTTRTPSRALAPWGRAGEYSDPVKRALSYAILAPNPHNRQPWVIDLQGDDRAVVWRDGEKNLPETDPFERQLTIGMGCFLEQMIVAASTSDHSVELSLFPEGEDGPVAIADFREGAEVDPLAAHVMQRRSCKEAFAATPVPDDAAQTLSALATVHRDAAMVENIKDITWRAWMTETTTPRTMKESVDLFRMGKAEINANPDGIDLGGPFLESLMVAGILTREAQMDPESQAFAEGVKMYDAMLNATPAYAVITTAGNTREDQIAAGRRWLRLNLTTTALGLSLHPVSQCLQEFPEMAAEYERAHEMLAAPGETVQMLGRLGYGPSVAVTPRWPLERKIRNAA